MRLFISFLLVLFIAGCEGNSTPDPGPGNILSGVSTFTVTAPDTTAYQMNGVVNPTLVLQRGQTYTFNINATGHPFYIMSVQGTNTVNAYTSGVSGNSTQVGTLTFTVPAGAPSTLYYNCSNHPQMTGTISVTD
jgi:hypothetical protein